MKITDATRNTIHTAVTNFVSTISPDEDVEIQFSSVDDGESNKIELIATKKSKTPNIIRTMELANNTLKVDIRANANGQQNGCANKSDTSE